MDVNTYPCHDLGAGLANHCKGSSRGGVGGVIIPSYLGRGGSQPIHPRTSHPPGLHTQLPKPVHGHNGQKFESDGGQGAGTLGPASRGSAGGEWGARECTSYLGGSGTNVLGSPPSPARGGGVMIMPSYLGRGGSLPLHTQWLKTYAREHVNPCLHTQWPKMRVCRGVSGGEGWEPRAGDPRVCRSWRRTCTSNLGGMNLCTWSLICQAPGAPPCRPGPDAFKWPTKTPAFSAHIYSRGIIPTGLDPRIII